MRTHTLKQLSDSTLLRDLTALVAEERNTTAAVVAHIGEADARRLYLPAGYSSMQAYCMERLHFSEQAAFKRIRAGRLAREFPVIIDALAEGRLHLSAVVLLSTHLTRENSADLIAAATHRSKAEVERMLAERFPRPDLPDCIAPVPVPLSLAEGATAESELSPGRVDPAIAGLVPTPPVPVPPKVAPLAPGRFYVALTIGDEEHEMLRYAQALMSHRASSRDLGKVFSRALQALIRELEKAKFATARKSRKARPSADPRHVPARVKGAVWQRDQGRCTFVGVDGKRCDARERLEFDHVNPVARGGTSTVVGLRLLCRAHNQHEAERVLGARFMEAKRAEAREARRVRRPAIRRENTGEEEPRLDPACGVSATAACDAPEEDLITVKAGLRQLGFRSREAGPAVQFSAKLVGATLEERMRAALRYLTPQPRSRVEALHP